MWVWANHLTLLPNQSQVLNTCVLDSDIHFHNVSVPITMGCGQSSAAVPSASSGVSAVKSDKLVKSYAFAHVSVGTNTDKTSQNGDVIESLQFVLSDYRESPSKSQVERMMDQEETSLMLDSYDDTDEENNIPENCRYDFIQPYSQFYRPEDNWTHFSDTDDETDGEDEAKAEMKNESKSNKKDGMTKVAHVGDQKPRVYTRKDLRDNKDLIPFGRKIYSRPLLVQLVEVSHLKPARVNIRNVLL